MSRTCRLQALALALGAAADDCHSDGAGAPGKYPMRRRFIADECPVTEKCQEPWFGTESNPQHLTNAKRGQVDEVTALQRSRRASGLAGDAGPLVEGCSGGHLVVVQGPRTRAPRRKDCEVATVHNHRRTSALQTPSCCSGSLCNQCSLPCGAEHGSMCIYTTLICRALSPVYTLQPGNTTDTQ